MAAAVYVHEFLLFSHVALLLLLVVGNVNAHPDDCPDSFDCGSLGTIGYPFTKTQFLECGTLAIQGCDDLNKTAVKHVQLSSGGKLFQVRQVDSHWPYSISIVDEDFSNLILHHNACEAFGYNNITLPPPSPSGTFYMKSNITVFKCNRSHRVDPPNNFFKNSTCPHSRFYFGPPIPDDNESLHSSAASCSVSHLPVIEGFALSGNPFPFLTDEITIQLQSSDYCHHCYRDRKGHCRLNGNGEVYCAIR